MLATLASTKDGITWASDCSGSMSGMKSALKAGAGLLGLSMILASCGSGIAPDGSGSVRVYDLKTEYRDIQTNAYVACDNVTQLGGNTTQTTNVAVSFALSGTLTSVDVGLRGVTTTQYDGNYNVNIPTGSLSDLGGNSFKTVFTANSINGQYLPQSLRAQGIVVNPAVVTIKTVNASNRVTTYAGFYASVTANTSTGAQATGYTPSITAIPVYSQCKVVNDTGTPL
jgi:hypothetical protein